MLKIYYLLHFAGILLVFLGYGSLIARAALQPDNVSWRKFGAIASGVGLFFILLGGFGILGRMGWGFPGWAMIKLGVWLALGAMTAFISRKPQMAMPLWWVTFGLGLIAVLTVIYKPLASVGFHMAQ
ncbi:hypothetical protein [Cerasicoccus arenae]|uniref:Invasion protein n=1 Tax=Cerasicoccus arenae TaxID=424488 RepID=A0A8J3DDN0_9BACT|nr:hypothetical protein [Cerasicoccus arenae]MBK1857404.1 hypothetical protein [Cerasicoccus arenae]GHC07931.1 hypothetical protein GCM10007047_26450 [Cerasicoccus arenae]